MRGRVVLALLCATAALGISQPASAFDTGPHSDITRDAMTAEGFGPTAADIGVVNNWFVDLYSNASAVPHSGHADTINEILAFSYGDREHWTKAVIDGAVYSHFDSTFANFMHAPGLEAEWDRMSQRTAALAREAAANNNPRALLSLIGLSLHEVQDFYSHTNWIDALGFTGADGPNWPAIDYGRTPTWFDVPRDVRDGYGMGVYAGGTPGHDRKHAAWNTDDNKTVVTGMAKDWPGRPGYDDAHIAAYFATRQWLQAIRTWVNDPALWRRAQVWSDRAGDQLGHDIWGATWIGMHSGHWQGQGEPCNPTWSLRVCGDREGPGGNLLELRAANKHYFEDWSKTTFRKQFQQQIVGYSKFNAGDPNPPPIASSQGLQRTTKFVRVRVLKYRSRDLSDVGPDDADVYTRATIAGQQRYQSGTINSHDNYSFPLPNAPFEWLKAVPLDTTRYEPVTSMQVTIRTSSARYSGTDDDVYLRVNTNSRFALDKRLYNDFERGDRDTYSVPIDSAVRAGLRVGDIRTVQIEKSKDGVAGGWKLRGVELVVNGRRLYAKDGIERWLEDDHRTWRAPDFRVRAPRGKSLPVSFDLYDDDYGPYGGDDHGDADPFGQRRTHALLYMPGTTVQRTIAGGNRYGGRLGDGEEATFTYRIETLTPAAAPLIVPPITVQPPVVQPSPPPPGPDPKKPDLVISAMGYDPVALNWFFTVTNQGAGAAGAFQVSVTDHGTFPIASLAPGASLKVPYTAVCENPIRVAVADSGGAVAETDETNNQGSYDELCIT